MKKYMVSVTCLGIIEVPDSFTEDDLDTEIRTFGNFYFQNGDSISFEINDIDIKEYEE